MKQYTLKFHQLSRYAPDLVSSMRANMRTFYLGFSQNLVLECKGTFLNNNMDISRLMVYIQQVEDEKRNKLK